MDEELNQDQVTNEAPAPAEGSEPPKSARELAMEQVIASRKAAEAADLEQYRQDLKAQGLPVPEEASTDPAGDASEGDEDQLQRKIQAEQAASKTKLVEDLDQTLVKIKVDGVEREVPLSELVRTAQKHEAADKRLAEATRLLQEAETKRREAEAPQQAQPAPAAQAPEQAKPDSSDKVRQDREQKAKEFLEAMFHGDEDRATQILAGLMPESPPPQETATKAPDPEELAAQVEASLERRSALKQFASAYPEVLKDTDLAALADMKLARRLAQGEPFSQALMSIGEELYTKTGLKTPVAATQETPPAAPSQTERVERKKAADPVRGRSASTASTQEAPPSPSDVIKQMQEARMRGRWNGQQARR